MLLKRNFFRIIENKYSGALRFEFQLFHEHNCNTKHFSNYAYPLKGMENAINSFQPT